MRNVADCSKLANGGPLGGIGRRDGLKIRFLRECRFESGSGHQDRKRPRPHVTAIDIALGFVKSHDRRLSLFVVGVSFLSSGPDMIDPVLPTYNRTPFAFTHGEGSWLYDEDGERYLDFGAGIAVSLLGHAHPRLVAALTVQASKLWHTSNLYRIPGQERLAQRLVDATFADTVFFSNSGAEAVEAAIKMARRYHYHAGAPDRYRLITFDGAFHGRTLAAIAAAGKPKLVDGFGPMLDGFDVVSFDDAEAVEAAIGPATAGVLLEPVQGEGGIRKFSDDTLRSIRDLCDSNGLLLLFDEVQCGMGRTGRLFAHEWTDVTPDVMAIAKGIGGGFPLGACLATERAASGMTAGSHGSTFGGNPLAMAVGNAVLDVVLESGFLERVRRVSGSLQQRLAGLVDEHSSVIVELRGDGLMLGLRCSVPVGDVVHHVAKNRLLAVAAAEDTLRILPPLNVTDSEVDAAMAALDSAFTELEGGTS